LAIWLYAASVVFLFYVSSKRKISALSVYWIFAGFQTLYCVMPWLTNQSGITTMSLLTVFSLLSDTRVIDTQLLLGASANLAFGIVFLFFYRNTPFISPTKDRTPNGRLIYVLLVTPIFLITFLLCMKYGWREVTMGGTNGNSPTGWYSVAINAKLICVGIYIYYLSRFGLDKWGWALFAGHVAILAVDNGRTTFMPVALLTFMVYSVRGSTRKAVALAGMVIVLSIGVRAAFQHGTALENMMLPILVEGDMGSYSSLQSIYAVAHHLNNGYTFGASYLLDPLVWLLPHSQLREQIQFFAPWSVRIERGLSESFSPWGGFYYMSEAVAAFSFFGPAIVAAAFGLLTIWMDKVKNKYTLLSMTWTSTIGILFTKAVFPSIFKMFIAEFMVVAFVAGVYRLLHILSKPLANSARSSTGEALPSSSNLPARSGGLPAANP
jgi:hypothetical protein